MSEYNNPDNGKAKFTNILEDKLGFESSGQNEEIITNFNQSGVNTTGSRIIV